ncbi:MAG: hydrolase [Thermotogae bacterium]|nr:hydrolase [Thermotogota bacterium]
MPSGKVHDAVNTILTFAAVPVGYRLGFSAEDLTLFALGSLFATFYLSPDLDLEGTRPVRRWGRLAFIWRPYSALMPHRGVSHYPFLGILTRLGYLFVVFSLLWAMVVGTLHYFGLSPPNLNLRALWEPDVWVPFSVGALFADTLHIFLDWAQSRLKRPRRRRR